MIHICMIKECIYIYIYMCVCVCMCVCVVCMCVCVCVCMFFVRMCVYGVSLSRFD